MKILAVSVSLRSASVNSALLRLVAQLAPQDFEIVVSEVIGSLPLFNPDIEASPPEAVELWCSQVRAADALLFASPEYAHGVTGAMKNALDWLVSFESFVGKPVAIINTSPQSHHADSALRRDFASESHF
jgi:chromate reductase, NAD(P)H dehydrogenase (quinone)